MLLSEYNTLFYDIYLTIGRVLVGLVSCIIFVLLFTNLFTFKKENFVVLNLVINIIGLLNHLQPIKLKCINDYFKLLKIKHKFKNKYINNLKQNASQLTN